ncbi:methyltransferase [Pararoseomonas indoligenes]|uniref:Methyltransferase domain-containing protein n=1 Tax=Roseomonas indoligenes TaxID=2820811 RepID=A0A940S8S4_9PROT|nr:methyltransferase [Pararoseomonas indoligenes]MBP0494488.1 methyltransferase domain-containing protein [Pararoseomonas indoligenes]
MPQPSTPQDSRQTVQALVRQAAARQAVGDFQGAIALYRRAFVIDPDEPNAMHLMGILARQMGEMDVALDLSGRAVAQMPESPVFLAARGATLAAAGMLEEAVEVLGRAVTKRPADAMSRRNLGQALCALGRVAEAMPHLREAVALMPNDPEAQLALAHGLREAGAPGAAEAARRALSAGGDVAAQARFLLASLGEGRAPAKPSAAYVRNLFDNYAPRFEAELTGALGYRTPEALAALLRGAGLEPRGELDVLDAGCGTGLSGQALRPWARHMTGVDLSPRMLDVARTRGVYETLEEAELVEFLAHHRGAYDLVAAADVLNYLGDLAPALNAMAAALRPGGHAAFSLETGLDAPYALGPGMRYRHDPAHVIALAEATRLGLVELEDVTLREERGVPVAGTLLVLRRN